MSLESSLAAMSLATPSPEGVLSTKTLVFKPKTAKTATPIPIIVVALTETQTPGGAIAKAAGFKEPRLAKDDLIVEFFGCTAKEFSIANLTDAHSEGKIKLVVDSKIVEGDKAAELEFVCQTGKLVLTTETLLSYFKSTGIEIIATDFSAEAAAPTVAVPKTVAAVDAKLDDAKLIGITVDKELDFSSWYQQILTKGEMLDYYDVSGCYIMRPASYAVWEQIQEWFNKKIKALGVQNAYFPMFVSSKVLEREKDHIEGFAPEVAWVTRAGSSELEEPIAIRPTSETVMYPYYAKWIRSHRDLPLKLNQWNSVVRWEFKHPQPFLRTREFLWQEGHTAHLTYEEANEEVLQILDYYSGIYEELLAVPVVKGKKTEKEKFAGGLYTTTCEGYIPTTGRGIQGATSHCLGQNFSKMFNITVESPEGPDKPKINVWQNSWGLSTRVIGVMVMIHSDNKGLVIPPRVSQNQVVIIPVGITAKTTKEEEDSIYAACKKLEARLRASDVRVIADYRNNYSPGWKFSDWELKGLPVRLELGPKDLKNNSVLAVRRDNGQKVSISLDEVETKVPEVLEDIQASLFANAKAKFDSHRVIVNEWKDFVPTLNKKNVILAPWCGVEECEDDIKDASSKKDDGEEEEVDEKAPSMGAKSLCIPFEQPELAPGQKCVKCDKAAINYCMFGRSY
ncbi:unnamed protein product [Kuraishia capsulata CBS 1993]|uniref:proline--tRNA ligase n=1 Tax=Kuraishia capsulata CBS 1993 TaxID=1382522 RepID=W6MHL3_9ASCO|nr:uncharacterized protein KUCA_T00001451001 [Kuraishia capsulata CBS 1993]CDK25481.1 unnamed protein product [Kuraishia capsulata CBS 1993]